MSLINTWFFTQTIVHWATIAKATGNQFMVVAVREFQDKKGKLPDGYTLTLMVLNDNFDYGIDKKTGKPRENNRYQNFDVTVLTRAHPVKKGDHIRLLGFESELSYAINFDMLLRFKDYEVISRNVNPKP